MDVLKMGRAVRLTEDLLTICHRRTKRLNAELWGNWYFISTNKTGCREIVSPKTGPKRRGGYSCQCSEEKSIPALHCNRIFRESRKCPGHCSKSSHAGQILQCGMGELGSRGAGLAGKPHTVFFSLFFPLGPCCIHSSVVCPFFLMPGFSPPQTSSAVI